LHTHSLARRNLLRLAYPHPHLPAALDRSACTTSSSSSTAQQTRAAERQQIISAANDPLSETYALLKQQCGDEDRTYDRIDQWVLVAKHIDIFRSDSSNPSHTLGTEYSVYDLTKFENGKLFSHDWQISNTSTKSRGGSSGISDGIVRFAAGESPPSLEFDKWDAGIKTLERIPCSDLRKEERGGAAWKYVLVEGQMKKVLEE